MGLSSPACTQIDGNAYGRLFPLSARLKISPVTKLSTSSKTDAARADTAQRESDHGQMPAAEDPGVIDFPATLNN